MGTQKSNTQCPAFCRNPILPVNTAINFSFPNYIDERNRKGYVCGMIKTFSHKGLERFYYTGSKRGIIPEHSNKLERILDRLNAATDIKDMNYPGSFLHQLKGDKAG